MGVSLGSLAGLAAAGAGYMVGGPVGAAMMTGGLTTLGVDQTNQANAKQAELNRQFQANMSNTSYQRGIADMQAAGLNPMLAYSQGGASTPQGSMAVMQDALGGGVQSGFKGYQAQSELANRNANTELQMGQRQLTDSQMLETDSRTALNNLELAEHLPAKIKNVIKDTELKGIISRATLANAKQTEYMLPQAKAIGGAWNSAGGIAAAGRLIKENAPGVRLGVLGKFGIE